MEEKLIKALSSLTGIRESKLKELEANVLYDIIDKPNIVEPTNNQLEKLNLLSELIINLGITKEFKYKNQINFKSSDEAGKYFKHLIGSKKDKEVFLLAMFDRNDSLMKIKKISEGAINSAIIYPRDIVKEVLSTKCKSVMFCHNHPSGITNPSDEDISMTKNLINILEPLKVYVRDHLIVGNDVFSFLKNNKLNVTEISKMKVADDEIIYDSNNYYENHLEKYLEALTSLTGISKHKINDYLENEINKKNNPSINALQIIEDPQKSASKLGLSSSERKKLENLKQLIDNMKELKTENTISIKEPNEMRSYYLNCLEENRMEDDNLYITLFDNKLRVIGFEKLTYREGNDLVYNSKDILIKSLAYEANSISIGISSKYKDDFSNRLRINILSDIAQNTINMLTQLDIKLLDVIHISDGEYLSLKDEGYLPYTNFGQPEYRKMKILEDVKEYHEEDEIEMSQDEQEDEWEFEL
ncbi:JAB domain-containing protein [Tissierella sp.]|uniref:JAB domain-containing protein n=1 Tax=Tissierella sp. TaxID=41274 RepID=UPI0030371846